MVPSTKLNNAFAAINAILVGARAHAQQGGKLEELAEVLDVAEYLPRLLAEPDDRSAEFREQLAGLAAKYPAYTFAVERFDDPKLGRW